jgi:benzoyl-CoA 2,3-epoxidase subunit B
MWSTVCITPDGEIADRLTWDAKRTLGWPSEADETYVKSLMAPVYLPGQMANWIAPPNKGFNYLPGEFEYVKQS